MSAPDFRPLISAAITTFRTFGADILKVESPDPTRLVFYITVPESSEFKTDSGVELAGAVLAKQVKTLLSKFMPMVTHDVKYKMRQEHWTKADGATAKAQCTEVFKPKYLKGEL